MALNLVTEENVLINKDSLISLLSLMYGSRKDLGTLLMIVLAELTIRDPKYLHIGFDTVN